MSLADGEKTEAPTQKRRDDSRQEGRIPRSAELTTSFVLLGSAMLLNVAGGTFGQQLLSLFGDGLVAVGSAPLGAEGAVSLIRSLAGRATVVIGTWGFALMAMGLAVAAPQARGIMTTKTLAPDFSRLSPARNASRLFGIQSLADLFKSLLKLGLIGFAVYSALGAAWDDILALAQEPNFSFVHVTKKYAVKLLFTAGGCYLALAVLDYIWQIYQHEQSLKMSHDEIKQESKQSEGDPLTKQRLRSFGRQLARRQMMTSVPRADVIITNPTHIAVALLYDPFQAPAPMVLAMGQRKVALRIREIAKAHGIPCIENKPLARALFANARVGQMIPNELYIAVAEILAFVIRRRLLRGAPLQDVTA